MKLLVGLGNPGEKYVSSRHNLGFMLVDNFLKEYTRGEQPVWHEQQEVKSFVAEVEWQPRHASGVKVILAKPLTFMNNSGMAVNLLSVFYKISPENIWIIHDELDLPFGLMKIRFGGAGAGHHGVESIINALHSDKFWRFRLGIGVSRSKEAVAGHMMKNVDDYVLGNFQHEETGRLKELLQHANKAVQFSLEYGLAAAMNKYNVK